MFGQPILCFNATQIGSAGVTAGKGLTMGLSFAMAVALLATVQDQPAKPDIVVVGEKPDPQQTVCEKVTPPGSRLIVKKVCATRAQWAERRRNDRDALDEVFRRSLQAGARGF